MRKRGDGRTIYIGLDESNHGRDPEIIAAVASLIEEDANPIIIKRKERMEDDEIIEFLNNEQRSFAYIKAEKGQLTKGKNQLIQCAPYLVSRLTNDMKKKEDISSIEIILDGEIKKEDIGELHNQMMHAKRIKGIILVGCIAYPKSQKNDYCYSPILVAADSLAYHLFRKHSFTERINAEENMIKLKR